MSNTLYYAIGGLHLRLEGCASLATLDAIPGFSLFATPPTAEADLTFRLDSAPRRVQGRLLHRFAAVDDHVECLFGIDAEGVYHLRLSTGEWMRYAPQRPALVECSPLPHPATARLVLWMAYAIAALRLGRVPVHSSAVEHQGQAVLCLGESGTGKSTHTHLWLQHIAHCSLLNDDSPIVGLTPEGFMAYGSPWSGKGACFRTEAFPIAAFVRLEQQPRNSIRRLQGLEAFAALHPSCPPSLSHHVLLLDSLTNWLSHAVQRVPIFCLGCLPDAEAARLCHFTLFAL